MKAWSASSGPTGVSSNVVTQISSDTESFESSPSVKSRETSPTASPMMPARRLVPGLSADELENDADPGNNKKILQIIFKTKFKNQFEIFSKIKKKKLLKKSNN